MCSHEHPRRVGPFAILSSRNFCGLLGLQATPLSALESAPVVSLSGASSASLLPSMNEYYHTSRVCQRERVFAERPYFSLLE